ncbi:MAG: IS66 family transposase, partial [Verrucomicrobia bacterium]|nr:IS66 family transposase [Verrucomicrobiota bacterium]
ALCPHCHARHSPLAIQRLRGQIFGMGFHVWAAYLRIALRLSVRLISKATRDLLHANIPSQTILSFVEQTSKDHRQTEEALLRAILKSPSIHVDETKMNILGVQQYVWVLTDGIHVVFNLTPGREADFPHKLLAQYIGTVVSDFYGGYDALPCRQQKCLVHLIRDLNDDLWKNPFDEEYEQFVAAVRDLIVPMIEDIQRYGLKPFHLKKHQRRVDRFYIRTIIACETTNELTLKYKKRFERYKDSMFTFLTHADVSWNNNAAERAIRHLAVQRKISGAFTTTGANHYLRLLAIAQTCRFQDKSFLGFLLSGLKNVDAYKETQRGHRR